MSIAIAVNGESEPLLGTEELLQKNIETGLRSLLSRRGFTISDSVSDLRLVFSFQTERVDDIEVLSNQSTLGISSLSLSATAGSGIVSAPNARGIGSVGVSIAQTVASLMSTRAATTSQYFRQGVQYLHTVSIEITDTEHVVIWKGESMWRTTGPDILGDVYGVTQLLLSELPADRTITPRVPRLKQTHLTNYFAENCVNSYFSCPALPYRIHFPASFGGFGNRVDWSSVTYIKDAVALPAFVDIVQTAEYALPTGAKDYKDPVDLDLWRRAVLGGKYLLGDSQEPTYVLVELYGYEHAYQVNSCRVVTAAEFANFESSLTEWRNRLHDYFDMFE
ncbi:MAG: hypothetical protein RBT76_13255 [candidate division Zixibacteria bacterium]|jgi:hypothetical protein|nr:hypothetical protein [candidate division Zixibacteria bacterium]